MLTTYRHIGTPQKPSSFMSMSIDTLVNEALNQELLAPTLGAMKLFGHGKTWIGLDVTWVHSNKRLSQDEYSVTIWGYWLNPSCKLILYITYGGSWKDKMAPWFHQFMNLFMREMSVAKRVCNYRRTHSIANKHLYIYWYVWTYKDANSFGLPFLNVILDVYIRSASWWYYEFGNYLNY